MHIKLYNFNFFLQKLKGKFLTHVSVFILAYSHPNMGSHDSLSTSTNGSYSGSIFKDLHMPGSNSRVHLLRINPLCSDENSGFSNNCLHGNNSYQDNISHDHELSSATDHSAAKHKGSNRSYVTSPTIDLVLPCESNRTNGKIMVLDGAEADMSAYLETEHINFSDFAPRFASPFDINTEKKDMHPGAVNLVDSLPNFKNNKLGSKSLIGQRASSAGSSMELSDHSGDVYAGSKYNSLRRHGTEGDLSSSMASDITNTVSTLECQIQTQVSTLKLCFHLYVYVCVSLLPQDRLEDMKCFHSCICISIIHLVRF